MEDMLKGILGGPLLYNAYFKTFGLKGDEKMLDFGCGGGAGSRCLANLLNEVGHLTCIDTSFYWISRAKKRLQKFTNVKCLNGDIRELNIPDFSFDIVTIIHVIHDISPIERADVTKVLGHKIKAGGRLFIRERIAKSHGIPVSELRTLLHKAGLKEIEYTENKSEYIGKYYKTS
ncbi:MAG: class I SAM-dependent methyltransferase [Dehalococcoidia bacterium]|nr:MAG: class I SAM-dependent methyltransferase [Dehalococcoidia bacterium]